MRKIWEPLFCAPEAQKISDQFFIFVRGPPKKFGDNVWEGVGQIATYTSYKTYFKSVHKKAGRGKNYPKIYPSDIWMAPSEWIPNKVIF